FAFELFSQLLRFADDLLLFFGAQVLKRSQRDAHETIGIVKVRVRPDHAGNTFGQLENQLLTAGSAQSVNLPIHNPQDGTDYKVGTDRDILAVVSAEDEELGAKHRHRPKSGNDGGEQRRILCGGKYPCTVGAKQKVGASGERSVDQKVQNPVSIKSRPQRLVTIASDDFRKTYKFPERDSHGCVPNRREIAGKDYPYRNQRQRRDGEKKNERGERHRSPLAKMFGKSHGQRHPTPPGRFSSVSSRPYFAPYFSMYSRPRGVRVI